MIPRQTALDDDASGASNLGEMPFASRLACLEICNYQTIYVDSKTYIYTYILNT